MPVRVGGDFLKRPRLAKNREPRLLSINNQALRITVKREIMKKILFLLVFILTAASSFAQEKYPYYCTISGTRNLANKIRLELEWGEQKQSVALRDENNKKIEFNNLTDILNYMSARGWQFVTELTYDGHVHYLLKKEVSSPDEAKQGLRFSTDE